MMKNLRFALGTAMLFLLVSNSAWGQASPDTMRTFIFGHSLIHHEAQVNPTPSQETSVPHWFHLLAAEAGYGYATSGQYGFIPQHANLPPIAQWGFDIVPPAWDSDHEMFSEADFDNILITPGNFIQYQPPHVNYYNDNQSPLDYTSQIFDWCAQQEDSLVFYIYENWPDMAGYLNNGFPASTTEWAAYNNDLNGSFHDWFLEYHDSLILAHPAHCVRMIPVGPVISHLLFQPPFDQIAVDTLYEDDAPHGRPTIYFLAALVTYMAMYEEPAPMSFQVPSIIDNIVANNYATVVNFIWNELQNFNDSQGDSRVFCSTPVVGLADDELQEDQIRVYPNPTSGLVALRGNLEGHSVQVFDLTGKRVPREISGNKTIDLSQLPNGLYMVRVVNEANGTSEVHKILKRD